MSDCKYSTWFVGFRGAEESSVEERVDRSVLSVGNVLVPVKAPLRKHAW